MGLGRSLVVAVTVLASVSVSSLPGIPLWPCTHRRVVVPRLWRRRVLLAETKFNLEAKLLVVGWAAAGTALARHRGHTQWLVLAVSWERPEEVRW